MIGKMRSKIIFQSATSTAIGGGGVDTVYNDTLTTNCEAKPLRSSRDLSEYQTVLKNGYQFKIRYRDGFIPDKDMLISFKSKLYTINSIDPDVNEQQRFWKIVGVEKQ